MSAFTLFLRALLCLCLVFYGSGVATAATGMQLAHIVEAHSIDLATGSAADSGPAPCHDAAEAAMTAGAGPIEAPDISADTSTSTDGSTDCCEASGCDCSCIQQVQVAVIALPVGNPAPARSTAVGAMTAAHASPALPHLIRPPIG